MRQLKIATQITNRDSQAVEKYLQEISKISMITPEEETTLAAIPSKPAIGKMTGTPANTSASWIRLLMRDGARS